MTRHRAPSWWYRGRHHRRWWAAIEVPDPRAWLTSATVGAAAVALPPMLMSTLMIPEASPASLPRLPAPTVSPLPIATSEPTAPYHPPQPEFDEPEPTGAAVEDEGVEETPEVEPEPTRDAPLPPVSTSCPSLLQGTRPHVAMAGWVILNRFGIDPSDIIGRAPRDRASEHPLGLALDFPVDRATGDRLAGFVLDHREELGVEYVIWRQRINFGRGFRAMEDRGSATANHFDHVHVSFRSTNGEAATLRC